MPLALALVAAASTVGGAAISANATNKATKAATQAADQNNALQARIFDTTNANYQPYRDLGGWAIPRLQQSIAGRYVPANAFQPVQRGPNGTILPPQAANGPANGNPAPVGVMSQGNPATSGYQDLAIGTGPQATTNFKTNAGPQTIPADPNAFAPQGAGAPGGGADWNAYLQANPDITANGWLTDHPPQSVGDINGDGQVDAGDSAALHYQLYGQNENRPGAPQPGAAYGAAPGGADSGAPNAFQYGPDPGPAPTFAGYQPDNRPDQGVSPNMPDLSAASFEASPGYEYALKEGLRGVNAYFGAKGVLNSGGALQEAIRQGQGMAQQDYYNWQNHQLAVQQQAFNQFAANRQNTNTNYDITTARGDARTDSARNFDYSQYLDNRNYNAGRFDTQNQVLGGLVNTGANATGAVANAGQGYANAFGANNNSAASATGNAAIAGANSVNGLIGNAFQTYGLYSGLRGNPVSSAGAQYGASPIQYPSSFMGY